MIDITISPRVNETTNKTWWFVEWPSGGEVDPSKMFRLLEIVYSDVGYQGTVGLSIKLVGFNPRRQIGPNIKTEPYYEVMFLDDDLAYRHPEHINGLSEYLQQQYVIVGVVFNSQESAELFKFKIEARWTFRALQKEYS